MAVTEKIHGTRIRLFEWKEKLVNEKPLESLGLLMFRVRKVIKKVSPMRDDGVMAATEFTNKDYVITFTLDHLLSPDSFQALAMCSIARTQLFLAETAISLAKDISAYLFSNFQFSTQTLISPTKPKIVIVVDVDMMTDIDCTKKGVTREVFRLTDDQEEDDDDPSEDEEPEMVEYEDSGMDAQVEVEEHEVRLIDEEEEDIDPCEYGNEDEEPETPEGYGMDAQGEVEEQCEYLNEDEEPETPEEEHEEEEEEEEENPSEYGISEDEEPQTSEYEDFDMNAQVEEQVAEGEVDQEHEVEDDSMDIESDVEEEHFEMVRKTLKNFLGEPEVDGSKLKGFKQVEDALKINNFDDCERVDDCPICLEGFSMGMVVATTPCSHMFHRDCIFRWLPDINSCPMCRRGCKTLI